MSTGAQRAGADHLDRNTAGDGHRAQGTPGRSLAQWFCLIAGLGLLLAGILGMTADNNFDSAFTDPDGVLQGDGFLGFEVNGWHNLVHILSGAVLLLGFTRHGRARTLAIAFGLVYAALLFIGLVDGNDILGLVPVNPADNALHGVLSLLGLGAGLASKRRRDGRPAERPSTAAEGGTRVETTGRDRAAKPRRDSAMVSRSERTAAAPAHGDGVDHREMLHRR